MLVPDWTGSISIPIPVCWVPQNGKTLFNSITLPKLVSTPGGATHDDDIMSITLVSQQTVTLITQYVKVTKITPTCND